jgi:hypothetical protein
MRQKKWRRWRKLKKNIKLYRREIRFEGVDWTKERHYRFGSHKMRDFRPDERQVDT